MPNDGACATQQSGQDFEYVDQLTRDYPSFSQVKRIPRKNMVPDETCIELELENWSIKKVEK